ncbi:hypothetical protein TBLA_0A08730 [Henningerozyma blattae CBS 6284]|uniref:RNA polymerase I-specific transcription initiation factor RRN10 n=1 Tax=Henningerozyma blattae (strain ATCC 34711 / CBS 6284 / DSM 70876 / NBRC 10599 / NRRL Y-10934 / UCD 77-7) TaxID=1071380 RepID=I2GX10_HENB6|nr:hypothetical protein TBLA_0A08730 [Tetrapisispora blattae CBS 6284]CCH58662.1 hypothetical protein TBLA_0A08730 [Tetrapisispora blattae CBS 6284]
MAEDTIYDACSGNIKHKHHSKKDLPASADEILAFKLNHEIPIPYKSREELDEIASIDATENIYRGSLIPQVDLKVLHYYASQLCLLKYPELSNRMDETALITLGLLVEQWVEDYLTTEASSIIEKQVESEEEEKDTDNNGVNLETKIRTGPSRTISKGTDIKDESVDI